MAITFKLKRLRRDFEHRAEMGESFAVKIETYLEQGSRKAPPSSSLSGSAIGSI